MSDNTPLKTFDLHVNQSSSEDVSDSDETSGVEDYVSNLERAFAELCSKTSEFTLAQYDYFEDLRRQIDIRRETLVDKINKISQEMIRQVEASEQEFKKTSNLSHLNYDQELSKLRAVANNGPKFKANYDSLVQEVQGRLKNFENKKESLTNYRFETNGDFVSDSFGFLNLDKKYINSVIHNFANNERAGGPTSTFTDDGILISQRENSKTQEDIIIRHYKTNLLLPKYILMY